MGAMSTAKQSLGLLAIRLTLFACHLSMLASGAVVLKSASTLPAYLCWYICIALHQVFRRVPRLVLDSQRMLPDLRGGARSG